jgi:hypothetical protein
VAPWPVLDGGWYSGVHSELCVCGVDSVCLCGVFIAKCETSYMGEYELCIGE